MKTKFTTIEFPVFCHYAVHVEVTTDIIKSMEKYPATKSFTKEPIDAEALSIHVLNEPVSFIFLSYNASVGVIAHESWHVVRKIMQHTGIAIDSETVAYHLGYLVDAIFQFIRGKRK